MTDNMIDKLIARAMMRVTARLPADVLGREVPVLALDPDFDDLPRDHTEGTIDDEITQEAVLRLARAAREAYEAAQWQPMAAETAPKDGTIIDVWLGDATEEDVPILLHERHQTIARLALVSR